MTYITERQISNLKRLSQSGGRKRGLYANGLAECVLELNELLKNGGHPEIGRFGFVPRRAHSLLWRNAPQRIPREEFLLRIGRERGCKSEPAPGSPRFSGGGFVQSGSECGLRLSGNLTFHQTKHVVNENLTFCCVALKTGNFCAIKTGMFDWGWNGGE